MTDPTPTTPLTLSQRHEALKQKIHSFRIPLGSKGLFVMRVFYLMAPIVGGGMNRCLLRL